MRTPTGVARGVIRICCTGAVLALLLMALRAKILVSAAETRLFDRTFFALAIGSYQDLAYVAAVTGTFAMLCYLAGNRSGAQRVTGVVFGLLASLSLLLGFVNVRAVAELGRPVNYQWLYYSHFMRSMDTYTALAGLLSWTWVARVVIACVGMLLAAHVLSLGVMWAARRSDAHRLGLVAAGALLAYFGLGWSWNGPADRGSPAQQNPVVALVASFLKADDEPVLARMPTRFGSEDFLSVGPHGASSPGTSHSARARDAGVRNIVVVILESVAAQYVWGPGGDGFGSTPELDRYSRSARRFVSFYAHQPSTTHSLVALLLGVYPPHSFRVVTREHPDIPLPSLSGELKRQGYRTAIFNGEDNRFQGTDAFLSHRQFDLIADATSGSCAKTRHDRDRCMVGALANWIDRDSAHPFFAVLWTAQTHFPYVGANTTANIPAQGGGAFTDRAQQATSATRRRLVRYQQALRETDRALGHLFTLLKERELFDSTLVIVAADHGEAFGQHGNAFHRFLYEEEVQVPLLLVNPRLFHGEIDSTPGGTIDLAPTVMDLLGYEIPAGWQGRSLFDAGRHGRVYLFGPYSGLFGYREASRKYIYDPIGNSDQLYDLAADPDERVNIAAEHPAAVQEGRERLAAWVQYLDRFYLQHGVNK